MKRHLVVASATFALTLLSACNQTSVQTPLRSFDRPSDVALTCTRYDPSKKEYDAFPLDICRPELREKNSVVDPEDSSRVFTPLLRALVVNSARGELAVVETANATIVDLDRETPGYGFLPVGRLPEHVRASSDGCRAATTNTDSCDLSVIDVRTLYNMPFTRPSDAGALPGGGRYGDDVSQRIVPSVGGRPLGARPSWIEMAPESKGVAACGMGTYRAWIALPACELVAEIVLEDATLKRGELVRALHVGRDATTEITDLTSIQCPSECGSADGVGGVSDGGVPPDQAWPATFAIDAEGEGASTGRLVIGDSALDRLSLVALDLGSGDVGSISSLTLAEDSRGTRVVRIAPRSPAGKFLYAVARDATVRVVDLDRGVECETNPDPRFLTNPAPELLAFDETRRLGCFPLGDPSTPPRSPYARKPGISLPNDAIARDVAFVHLDAPLPPISNVPPPVAGPSLWVGDFAWIIGSDGRATAINIYDACPAPNIPIAGGGTYTPACDPGNIALSRSTTSVNPGRPVPYDFDNVSHHLRPAGGRFVTPTTLGDVAGAPRVQDDSNPVTYATGGIGGLVTQVVDGGAGTNQPSLVSVALPPVQNGSNVRWIDFPDPDHVRNETWTLAWEGPLPTTTRDRARLDSDGVLTDVGASFCARGALPGDKIVLSGCESDADCNFAQTCVRDPAASVRVTRGLCVDRGYVNTLKLLCSPLMRAERVYRVRAVTETAAQLSEIYEPEYSTQTHVCLTDDNCSDVKTPVDGLSTSCLQDFDGVRRCLRACREPSAPGTSDADAGATDAGTNPDELRCGEGFLCTRSLYGDSRCLRAPLDLALLKYCANDLQDYEVRAGETFLLTGSTSGFLPATRANPTSGQCELAPVTSSFLRLRQGRVPLEPPPCPPIGTPGPSGAITTIQSIMPIDQPPVCVFASGATRQIHIENSVLSFGLNLPGIPAERLTMQVIINGGSVPLQTLLGADFQAQQPRTAITAPDRQTVFVIDEGKQTNATGIRGQLLLLNSNVQSVDRNFAVR